MGFFLFGSFVLMVVYKSVHGIRIVRGPMAGWKLIKRLAQWYHG